MYNIDWFKSRDRILKSGFVYDEQFLKHDTGAGHPECAQRLEVTSSYLNSQDWFTGIEKIPAKKIEEEWLLNSHSAEYLQRARNACLQGNDWLDSMDVSICAESYEISLLAAGAPIVLADRIIDGSIDNGFVLARPPGHHAERDQALGFCLFNNVAILARYLQKTYGLEKILILDWDVHHGNGTQHTFEEDPSVLYVSTHEYPYYPGTGAYSETGIGKGRGATLNCPMPAGSGDQEYETAFMQQVLPKIDAFAPEFVIISAGFDAHRDDPLGHIQLSTDFYAWMSSRLLEVAEKHCQGRIISVLEGGYNLDALPLCIGKHLQVLAQLT